MGLTWVSLTPKLVLLNLLLHALWRLRKKLNEHLILNLGECEMHLLKRDTFVSPPYLQLHLTLNDQNRLLPYPREREEQGTPIWLAYESVGTAH